VLLVAATLSAGPVGFVETDLRSDQTALAGNPADPSLVNAWGIASGPTTPFWIGANHTGVSVVYNTTGGAVIPPVTILGDGSVTGVTFAEGTGGFNGDLLPVRFRGRDRNAAAPNLVGSFTDPTLPAGYAPFDVAVLGGVVYVTYALQNGMGDEAHGAGLGLVDRFDLQGNFLGRLVNPGGDLNAPWGMAIAPAGFSDLAGDLLVGNFGDGTIHAYNATTGAFAETLVDGQGNPLVIDGLWGLLPGNGGMAGQVGTVYFTAGPDDEMHGLFGALDPAPEPRTWSLAAMGLLLILVRRGRRRATGASA
jgi:hypothetical protein